MDAAELERLARLARLHVSPAEAQQLARDISALLEAVCLLDQLQPAAEPVPEEAGPLPPAPAEADVLHAPPSYIAPEWRAGFFVVTRQ